MGAAVGHGGVLKRVNLTCQQRNLWAGFFVLGG
jgi:hypothetical protein